METNFYSMEFFFSFHENFSTYIQKDSLHFSFMLCSYFQHNECKQISKFERDDKSNGIPLLQHGIFFFFYENFPVYIQKDSLHFFSCCVRISRIMNAKKSRNSRGKTRAMESHFYNMEFFFLSREFFCEHSQRFLPIFYNAVLVFLE